MVDQKIDLTKFAFKPTEDHDRNYAQVAYNYALTAIKDEDNVKHCKWVKAACKRFLKDLTKQSEESYKFKFVPWFANDICHFVEQFEHIEGDWDTKTIKLEPCQIFILCSVFGWRKKENIDLRRFTSVYIELARKGAKSTLTAAVSLYCLTEENENGPQIIIGATTGEQAKKVFEPARIMAKKSHDYRQHNNVEIWAKSITCLDNNGFIQTINAKSETQDGWNPHVGILDELHAHKTRSLYDVIKSAFGARKNPLLWVITTAGYNVDGVCYEQRTLVTKILDEVIEADHYFGIIFTLDQADIDDKREFDPRVWIKSNPMLGITPTLESMHSYALEAKNSPASRSEFLTKRCNVWTAGADAWLNIYYWRKCARPDIDFNALRKVACCGGLDLASTQDITALSLVWSLQNRLVVWGRYFVPEDRVKEMDQIGMYPYRFWMEKGYLETTPGNTTDYGYIEQQIYKLLDEFNIVEWGYDPWNSTDTVNRLVENDAPMVEVRQGPKTFNYPMREFERHMIAGTLEHDDNPVLNWMASNVVKRNGVNDEWSPDKKNSHGKIDGIVSILNGYSRAINHVDHGTSIYERMAL